MSLSGLHLFRAHPCARHFRLVPFVAQADKQNVRPRALCVNFVDCGKFLDNKMDPSPSELAAITDLASAVQWIGMRDDTFEAVCDAMGGLDMLREIVLIPAKAWDEAVLTVRIKVPGAGDTPPSDRAPRPRELGQIGSLRRIARIRLGLPPDEAGGVGSASGSAGSGGGQLDVFGGTQPLPIASANALAVPQSIGRKVKMATVFDQGDDSELAPWTPARAREVLASFVAANGGEEPDPDEEPSADQLAALDLRLRAGGSPCPDFGVWRPHGRRLARQLKLQAMRITPEGTYVPYEIAGPPDFAEWLRSFRVLGVALRALGQVDPARLGLYENHIRKLSSNFGSACWWLVAQAEQRMRSEQFDRLRRRAETAHKEATLAGGTHPFDPARPWDHVFRAAVSDDKFWTDEVTTAAVLFISRCKSQAQLADPGHGASTGAGSSDDYQGRRPRGYRGHRGTRGAHHDDSPYGPPPGKGKDKGSKGKGKGKDKGKVQFGNGTEICRNWNRAPDGCAKKCPNNRRHVCDKCGGDHRAIACPTAL